VPFRLLTGEISAGISETFSPGAPLVMTSILVAWQGSADQVGVEITLNDHDIYLGQGTADGKSHTDSVTCWIPIVPSDVLKVTCGSNTGVGFAIGGFWCPLAQI
jgi:hypothetical protein